MSRLSGEVALRSLEHTDAERMLLWMLDPYIADNVGLRSTPTLQRTQEWIAKANAHADICAWAILHDACHVGNVVLDHFDNHLKSARLSIYIGEAAARGKGVASIALEMALRQGFGKHSLFRIWLMVQERNTRAALVYARCGFSLEGILRGDFLLRGERVNTVLMSMLRSEFAAQKAPMDQ